MSDWSQLRAEILDAGEDVVMLLDKSLEPVADLRGALAWRAPRKANETAVASLKMVGDHPAVNDLLALSMAPDNPDASFHLLHEAYYLYFQDRYERDLYRVARISDPAGTGGENVVTVEAKSMYRWVEKVAFRASPGDPLIAQLKYRDMRSGRSLQVIKEYFLVNLMNDFQPGGVTGWDLWAPASWSGVNPSLWPAIVNPVHDSSTTEFTVLDARFDMAGEMIKETLDAAGLLLTIEPWFVGDPQPFPDHAILTRPTLIIDVVSRQFDTAATGTPADMLRGLVRTFDSQANAPRIGLGTLPATAAGRLPWVLWRPEDMGGVTAPFTVLKSEDSHVIVGGRSPEALNRLVAGSAKAIFGGVGAALAGAIPVFGGLINAAAIFLGEVVGESLKDKLFAWQAFFDAKRRAAHGWFTYRTQVGAGDGWTLSAFQQGFQMLQAGAGSVEVAFEVADQCVYEQGRDYSVGDQTGVLHRDRVYATFVSETARGYTETGSRIREVTLGDPRTRESAVAALNRSAKSISNAVSRYKTFIM